jgi:uncharacterized protein (DUF1015 family)
MPEPLIKPFKGLLYGRNLAGAIDRCVCPPYDIIPDAAPFYGRSPFNAIRLELPSPTDGLDQYDAAKQTLDAWMHEGVLRLDDRETIYVYEQEFTVNGVVCLRRGLIPLVRLDRKRILTHEETRKKAREDRERLIDRLKVFTSLVFAMYDDRARSVEGLVEKASKEKLYDFLDEQSIWNRFYRMTDADEIRQLMSLMEEKDLYIADGHHRLSVSFKLGLPYVAIYITDMYARGITILPYHRIVKLKARKDIAEVLQAAGPFFESEEVAYKGPEALRALIDDISSAPVLSFLLYHNTPAPTLYLLRQKQPVAFDPAGSEIMKKLRVNVIHSGVLKHLMGIGDEEISFPTDPDEAVAAVDEGHADFAVFVPATSVEEVRDIADNGLFMPPKSTYFYPKILTGLVFYKYA